ncbi:protein phosphatase 2C domain-containing protein [Streptomyces sp. NPDC050982]|uniref:protein phosphatase 2C domain-containing protein n=1 Tax=Streptomyces sp. NPDC050982 TaxID=3154746 RepID=UPI0033D872D6
MSQQGEKPTGQEDDWWGQLYDDSTGDTGPAAAGDSLDDRFASASDTLGAPADAPPPTPLTGPAIPPPRTRTPTERRRLGADSEPAEPTPADEGPPPDGPAVTGFGTAWPVAGWGPSDRQPPEVAGGPPPGGLEPGGSGAGGPAARGPVPDGRAANGPARGRPAPGGEPEAGGEALRPGEPENDPLRRSGLQRQRAPWEAPLAEPPTPTSFPPGSQPPVFEPLSPRLPAPEPEGPRPPVFEPLSPRLPAPEPEGPQPPVFRPMSPQPPDSQPPGPHAAAPRSGTSTEAPGAGAPVSRAPSGSDASPPPPGGTSPYVPPATLVDAPPGTPSDQAPVQAVVQAPDLPAPVDYVGSGPPTYDAEPTALPPADADDLDDLVADTVLDGAAYGTSTLRAVSVRGDSARYRGEPRRDSLLTARFGVGDGALVLVAMATGARATPGAHRAAAEACQWIGRAVGRSHARLAEDIRAARRGDLKSGLHRLTDRSLGKLRASAAEQGIEPEEYTASLRCLLLPGDPECRTRVFFGVGAGGLFRLRDGEWQDIEPHVADTTGEAVVGFGSLPHETPDGDRLTMDLGITTPPSPYEPAPEPPPRDPFRFRASVARPGDTLLLCTSGLAEPLRGEPGLAEHLTSRWSDGDPPGLAAFLADTLVRVKGYADDRTAAAVWEA